jgi:hypothetical protein
MGLFQRSIHWLLPWRYQIPKNKRGVEKSFELPHRKAASIYPQPCSLEDNITFFILAESI